MHLQALGFAVPFGLGWRLGIAVVIVLISVIGGRIVPAFTRNWLNARGTSPVPPSADMLDRIRAWHAARRHDRAGRFCPTGRRLGALLLIAAALNLVRLARWRGVATLRGAAAAGPACRLSLAGRRRRAAGTVAVQQCRADRRRGARADRRRDGHDDPGGDDARHARPYRSRAARRQGDDGHLCAGERMRRCCASAPPGRSMRRWTCTRSPRLAWVGAFALFAAEYGPMLLARAPMTRQYCTDSRGSMCMKAVVCEAFGGPGSPGVARCARSAAAWTGRGAGPHRGARRAVRRRADARRQVSVPTRTAVHSRRRGGRRGRRGRVRRHAVPRRRPRDEPPQPRRLRRTRQRQGRAVRSRAGGHEHRSGRRVPRRVFHRLPRAAAARTDEGRANGCWCTAPPAASASPRSR